MSSKTRQNLQADIKRSRRLELVQSSKTGNFPTNNTNSIQSYETNTSSSKRTRRRRPVSASRNRRINTDQDNEGVLNSDGGSPVSTQNRRRRTYTYEDDEDDDDEIDYSENKSNNARPQSAQRIRGGNKRGNKKRPQSATVRRRNGRSNSTSSRQRAVRVDHKNVPEALARSKELLEEAREYLLSRTQDTGFELEQMEQQRNSNKLRSGSMNSRKKKRRPQSARRRSSPRKMVRSPQKRRRNMRRPVSAVALSRKNNQKRAMKMRKSKSTQNGNLLKAARGGISSNKRGISKSRKQKMQTIKNNIKRAVTEALLSLDSVLDVGAMKIQNIGDGDVVIDTHILVDSRTTVKQAHKIATRARRCAMRSHDYIADVIVHVDAQQRLFNGRLSADIEEDICSALATVKEIYSVAQANVARAKGRVIADVEILVNPNLLMREVHYVARRARKVVEDVPGVDQAEIHLELADENTIARKHAVDKKRSRARTGSESDRIVNASNMKSANSPQTTTDEEDMYSNNRTRRKLAPPPPRPPMIDTSSHTDSDEENMYADDFDDDVNDDKNGNNDNNNNTGKNNNNSTKNDVLENASKDVIDSYISPQKVYNRNGTSSSSKNKNKNRDPFHSPDPRTMSPASQQSARQSARSQRISSIVQDPSLRQLLRQMNEHILRSVHYRRFKYEKRLVAIGTTIADMDRSGRGSLSAAQFKNGLIKSDCGLSVEDMSLLIELLVGEEKYSGKNSTVRYADVIDALRKLQRLDADGNGSSTEDEKEGQRQAILKYKEYRNKIAEENPAILYQHTENADQGAGENKLNQQKILDGNSGSDENIEYNSPTKSMKKGTNHRIFELSNENRNMDVNTPSPKLTYAEKDRKELEAKLHQLQSEQQQALEEAKKKLELEKEALIEREKKFEDERKAKMEALEEEKRKALEEKERLIKENEEREKKAQEEEMRVQLKKEWLAREQAQQKRLQAEKDKRKREEEEKKQQIEKEKLELEREKLKMEQERKQWEMKQLEEERKRTEKLEREQLEKEKADLAKAMEEEKMRLQKEKEDWEKQQLKELEEAKLKAEKDRLEKEEKARKEYEMQMEKERKAQQELTEKMAQLEARLAIEEAEKEAILKEQKIIRKEELERLKLEQEKREKEKQKQIQEEKLRAEKMRKEKEEYELRIAEEKAALEAEIQKAKDKEERERIKREEEMAKAEEQKFLLEKKMKEDAEKARLEMEGKIRLEMEEKMKADAKKALEEAERERAEAQRLRDELDEQERLLKEKEAKVAKEKKRKEEEEEEKERKRKEAEEEEAKKQQLAKKEEEEEKKRLLAEEEKKQVKLAKVPDTEELTPQVGHSNNVQQQLFSEKELEDDDSEKNLEEDEEQKEEKESIKVDLNNSIRMRRLSRSITIDTDTDLEEQGEIEPYKSPKVLAETNSNAIGIANQVMVVDSVRTTRGGETDRELESGDTFDENSMMPMQSWTGGANNMNSNIANSNGNGENRKWEPIATPTGKNLYWYNWQSGESQWEKPAEVENLPAKNALPLPSTPKTKDYRQAHDLWNILLKRSTVVAVKGDWHQMKDSQTNEHFYHNPKKMISQWELPKNINESAETTSTTGAEQDGMITPKRKTNEDVIWEGIATPMGRNLYYYNWHTGESSWEKPNELKTPQGVKQKARILPSTPKSEDEKAAKKLWSVLVKRAERQRTSGEWGEMLDSQTGEKFYYNETTGTAQWEVPNDWVNPGQHQQALQQQASTTATTGNNNAIHTNKHGKRWEPIATPKGKNLYYYDWHTGHSQWEKPDALKSPEPTESHVLPSNDKDKTMSELSESQQLWDALRHRSKTQRIQGDWLEMLDPHSQERFYYNTSNGTSQWEMPKSLSGGRWEEAHTSTHQSVRSEVWEPVMTPKGRLLYYYNKNTGAAQRQVPVGYDAHTSSQGEHLPSTPGSADLPHTKRLWKVMLSRSRTIQTVNGWAEMIDDATQEVFYHLSTQNISQWEKPPGFDEAAYTNTSTHQQRQVAKSKWQPVATPKGKNLYFWNTETGESQWEKPPDYFGDDPNKAQKEQHLESTNQVLPSTPKAGNAVKAKKMWQVLRSRSKAIRVEGNWTEFLDEQTGEYFFYNSVNGTSQWEMPDSMKNTSSTTSAIANNNNSSGGGGSYAIDI